MAVKWYVRCPECRYKNIQEDKIKLKKCSDCGRLLKDQPIFMYTEADEKKDAITATVTNVPKNLERKFVLYGEDKDGKQVFIDILPQKEGYFLIGRQKQENLLSPYISRYHATIRLVNKELGEFEIWDHSTNGTLLNGMEVKHCERAEIRSTSGEVVRIGDVITLDANGKGIKLILQCRNKEK